MFHARGTLWNNFSKSLAKPSFYVPNLLIFKRLRVAGIFAEASHRRPGVTLKFFLFSIFQGSVMWILRG